MSSSASTAAGRRRAAGRNGAKPKRGSGSRPAGASSRGSARKPARAAGRRRPRARPRRTRGLRAAAATRLRRWRARLLIGVACAAALAGGYLLWLRDSSWVAVDRVKVEGITGSERGAVTSALTAAAEQMTTLHVRDEELEAAVRPYPTVAGVSADPDFPHGITIHVTERPPALIASSKVRTAPVAADGTVLSGVEVPASQARELPALELEEVPASGSLTGAGLQQALVVGAVPLPLRPLIEGVGYSSEEGVEVTMKGDIPILFGSAARADSKWAAAAAVLADPQLTSVEDIDVSVPERTAVTGTGDAASAATAEPATTTAAAPAPTMTTTTTTAPLTTPTTTPATPAATAP